MGALKQAMIDVPHYCSPCGEMLADGQMVCPFCDRDATPIDELGDYAASLRDTIARARVMLKRGDPFGAAKLLGEVQ